MDGLLHLSVLLLAIAIGWLLGRNPQAFKKIQSAERPLNKHPLQLLFDSYNDEALDEFIHSLEVKPETLNLHLSIGKHFRQEGEVDKAILVHQNLLAHPQLSTKNSAPIIYELAKDYKAAGLFDRAESLLQQLLNSRAFSLRAKRLLLELLEHEKEWEQAIEIAKTIDVKQFETINLRVAHYYCEIAEADIREGGITDARRHLKRAMSASKLCTRAYLTQARLEMQYGRFNYAIKILKRMIDKVPDDTAIALPVLLECSEASDTLVAYQKYLMERYDQTGDGSVLLFLVEALVCLGEDSRAIGLLERAEDESPSLSVLELLIQKVGASDNSYQERILPLLLKALSNAKQGRSNYVCGSCGFSGKQLHWRCPSCKSWQTIKPKLDHP